MEPTNRIHFLDPIFGAGAVDLLLGSVFGFWEISVPASGTAQIEGPAAEFRIWGFRGYLRVASNHQPHGDYLWVSGAC